MIIKLLFYCLVGFIFFALYVRFLEKTTVFLPSRQITATPAMIGLSFEDVYFKTADNIILNGWFVPSSGAEITLIFFHGNAGNIGDRLGKIDLFHQIGINVFIIDYRGYGNSKGKISEGGMYEDALASYDHLLSRPDVDAKKIMAYGASLGGAAAVDLATKRDLSGLIIDSAFSRAADIAKHIFPFIPDFLIQTKLDSLSKIKKISIPKLFIHSVDDETVPYALGQKLFQAAPEPKKFVKVSGGHNDAVYDQDNYIRGIEQFLKKYQ